MKISHYRTALIFGFFLQSALSFADVTPGPSPKPLPRSITKLPLDRLKLPKGFTITVFADNVPGARSLAIGPTGTVFVGTRDQGKVYALVDRNHDFRAEERYTIATGLKMPNGVAVKDGALYVAEVSKILRYDKVESHLSNVDSLKPVVVTDQLPTETAHGWKFIRFGPDGNLYVPIGAPCNVCESENTKFATIQKVSPDGSKIETFASGVRNTVGFDWHPQTKELWFNDNGRDWMGDDIPSDELNRAHTQGMHYGFPYCHAGDLPDPEFGKKRLCRDFTPPAQKLGAHVAPLGMRFYTGKMFPPEYQNQIILAEHGSWNRKSPVGYRLSFVQIKENKVTKSEPFVEGWLTAGKAWGRPVDVEMMEDGSLLVSDDKNGVIYRLSFQP